MSKLNNIYKDENIKDDGNFYYTKGFQYSANRIEALQYVVISHSNNNESEVMTKLHAAVKTIHCFISNNGYVKKMHAANQITNFCGNGVWNSYGKGENGNHQSLDNITFNIMLEGNGCLNSFSPKQYDSLIAVLRSLKKYGELTILGLNDVNPHPTIYDGKCIDGNDYDPGNKFDWALLVKRGYGKYPTIPEILSKKIIIKPEDEGVTNLQLALKALGYNIEITDIYDQQSREVTRAFLEHYDHGIGNEIISNFNHYAVRNIGFTERGIFALNELTDYHFEPLLPSGEIAENVGN